MASTINMLPAIQQLCQIEQTCPLPAAPGAQGIVRQNSSTPVYSQGLSRPVVNPLPRSFASDPLVPADYELLVLAVKTIWDSHLFSQTYCERLIFPLYQRLTTAGGKPWFEQQLTTPERKSALEAIIHAIVQNFSSSTDVNISRDGIEAAREITSDLYQTFQQRKCQVEKATKCVYIPSPIPYWSNVNLSTYPNTSAILGNLKGVGIVNIPKRYASQGVLAWGCLGHEVAGHDLLASYPGAQQELEKVVVEQMQRRGLERIAPYWARWLNEAASDVIGVLHMGPAGAFSLIGFLRAIGQNLEFKLSDVGYLDDPHPVDIIRGFVVQAAVSLLPSTQFAEASHYAQLIDQELMKDLKGTSQIWVDLHPEQTQEKQQFMNTIRMGRLLGSRVPSHSLLEQILTGSQRIEFIRAISSTMPRGKRMLREEQIKTGQIQYSGLGFIVDECKNSARIFAEIIMNHRLQALGGQSFGMIRSWSNLDEKICKVFRAILPLEIEIIETYKDRFASQVVAAAVIESISETQTDKLNTERLQRVFQSMISTLKILHSKNPEWKGFVSHQAEHKEELAKKSPNVPPVTPPTDLALQGKPIAYQFGDW